MRPAARDWRHASGQALIDHVIERYHSVHRQQLPALVRQARRVEQLHADHPQCPHGLAELLASLAQELESHMRKEEAVLFPLIVRGRIEMTPMPIQVLRGEHDQHAGALRRIVVMCGRHRAPDVACATWRSFHEGLGVFREDLLAHIRFENRILFARCAPATAH